MPPQLTPPPPIARETMLALLAAATEFAAAKPWAIMANCDLVGLTDPRTAETRLASVLGNGGEMFGVVIYRRAAGLHWVLHLINNADSVGELDFMEGIDCLKLELLPKREMGKADLACLQALNFKPAGRGQGWPQFQSSVPGWMPWFIDQAEAEQLLADLPRLTRFYEFFHRHPDLYQDRLPCEIPVLPQLMPDRPLIATDLEWRLFQSQPAPGKPFRASDQQLARLRSLPRAPKVSYEYGCKMMVGGSILEAGRPCLSRISLLVEQQRGMVLGFELSLGTVPFSESAGQGLVKTLLKKGLLPAGILIDDLRLAPILQPFCEALQIKLMAAGKLDFLTEAMDSLSTFMQNGPR